MPNEANKPEARLFIGVRFACCGVYARIYLNKAGNAYAGHCPRCATPLTIKAAPGGSSEKFWVAE